ncbi:YdcF family protein [Amycolatopsis ultiminotia]|uniref:YdcF family protein n=1 Tax=Amycolatopsis ultiminotia TaxID=543629 RepID=A0ABP6VZW3_9PSEU
MVAGLFALFTVLVFVVRLVREPRRFGNAVWFAIALLFTGMWLLSLLNGSGWVQTVVVVLITVLAGMSALVLPWALIVNGVVMLRREGRRLANLLSLLAGLAMLGIYVLTVSSLVFSHRILLLMLASSALLVAGYLGFVFTGLLLYSVLYSRLNRRARADAVIVLGSGLLGDRVPPLLASRLDRAVEVRQRSPQALLVVSGGQGPDESTSEAAAMARYLTEAGVPESQVVLEDRATTTDENLRFSADLLAARGLEGRMLAVTNNYHVFRTAVLARRLGLRLDVIGAKTASYFVPSAFLREFVALLAQYRKTNGAALIVLAGGPILLTILANL